MAACLSGISGLAVLCTLLAAAAAQSHQVRSDWTLHDNEYVLAYINVTYGDRTTGSVYHQGGEIGKFSTGLVAGARGRLVHVRSRNGTAHHGCDSEWENELPPSPLTWVALIRRGFCNFDVKVENAYRNNASAVVIYDYKEGDLHRIHLTQRHRDTIVTVFIPKTQGEDLALITDSGVDVAIQITPGKHFSYSVNNLNKTSVLFVSVSFILLMVISLAWLLFYYVQRFRYMHAKDRLAKRLMCAAKKALSRIPIRSLKSGDEQLCESECCAVCLEPYRISEQLRILPCSHEFHKQCVDPWLLKNRTCPMCKMDILKYYGLSSISEESIIQLELEAVTATERRNSARQPAIYVTSHPAPARSRSTSRTSMQSMSLVLPSPACVESLHGRGAAAGGATSARCRRVSAVLGASHRPEPPRRRSAPARPVTSIIHSVIHEPLGRSLSYPPEAMGPATPAAAAAADEANAAGASSFQPSPPLASCCSCQGAASRSPSSPASYSSAPYSFPSSPSAYSTPTSPEHSIASHDSHDTNTPSVLSCGFVSPGPASVAASTTLPSIENDSGAVGGQSTQPGEVTIEVDDGPVPGT